MKGRRALLLVVPAAVAAAAAGIYCAVATPRYDARAYVLVSPVARDDPAYAGIPVVRASDDPQAAARTVARLVATEEVAEAVRLQLGSELSRSALLEAVSAHAQDDTVAIEGTASSAPRPAQIANAFATELVAQRTARFQADRAATVGQLRRQLTSGVRSEPERKAIARRLAVLDGLAGTSDPTVRVASAAAAPAHARGRGPGSSSRSRSPSARRSGWLSSWSHAVAGPRCRRTTPSSAAARRSWPSPTRPAAGGRSTTSGGSSTSTGPQARIASPSGRRMSSTCASTPTPRGGFRVSSTLSSRRRSATSSLPTSR